MSDPALFSPAAAAVVLGQGGAWNVEHLEATCLRLTSTWRLNWNVFEAEHGPDTYNALVQATVLAAYHLKTDGAIPPLALEVVEAYFAQPKRTGCWQDDWVDFRTPRARLSAALAAFMEG